MAEQRTTLSTEQNYSSEFKLQVILEYIRNPKRQKRIIKDNGISEELLAQWHQEFVAKAS